MLKFLQFECSSRQKNGCPMLQQHLSNWHLLLRHMPREKRYPRNDPPKNSKTGEKFLNNPHTDRKTDRNRHYLYYLSICPEKRDTHETTHPQTAKRAKDSPTFV